MSAAAVMAVAFFLFFLLGVGVGVLVVIALSARRAHPADPQARPVAPSQETWPYRSGPGPGPGPGEGGPDGSPWWHARGGD